MASGGTFQEVVPPVRRGPAMVPDPVPPVFNQPPVGVATKLLRAGVVMVLIGPALVALGGAATFAVPGILAVVLGAWLLRAWIKLRSTTQGLDRSELLVAHRRATSAHVTPIWLKRTRRSVHFALLVASDDGLLAQMPTSVSLALRPLTGVRLDPRAPFSLVRGDETDAPPLLVSSEPPQAILAVQPLVVAGTEGWREPHPTSQRLNQLTGWGAASGAEVQAPPHELVAMVAATRVRIARLYGALGGFVGVFEVIAVRVNDGTGLISLLAGGVITVVSVAFVGRWLARRPLLVLLRERESVDQDDAAFMVTCLMAAGVGAPAARSASSTASPAVQGAQLHAAGPRLPPPPAGSVPPPPPPPPSVPLGPR